MLIDAHAHLDHYDDPTEALKDIAERRILTIANSMDPASYSRNLNLAERCHLVLPTFGIHPARASEHADEVTLFEPLVNQSPMLGELGLDFHWVKNTETYRDQIQVFEFLVKAASAQGKIVNLHTKGAEERVLDTLVAFGVEKAIIHWYSGPLEVLERMIARGYLFTIGVEILYSERIRTIARSIPLDQLLSETDNPGGNRWLGGAVGLPGIIIEVLDVLADLKELPREQLESVIHTNFLRLVGDDPRLETVRTLLGSTDDEASEGC